MSDEDTSSISSQSYIKINFFATVSHFVSALLMLILYLPRPSLKIPYTESYLEWNRMNTNSSSGMCPLGSRDFETSSGRFCIGTVTKPVSCDTNNNCYGVDLGWLVISFHILSFLFQGFAHITNYKGPILGYRYSDMIDSGKNPLRFIEYSFSASIMLISIALLNGVTDINLITSIGILTSACQLCGLAVEYIDNKKIKILIHLVGWLQFCWAYGIIGHAFFRSIQATDNGPPGFVYVIVIVLFLLYSSFGFVQLYELTDRLNIYTKEKAYVILSLTAKLTLGWMIFSNVLLLSR